MLQTILPEVERDGHTLAPTLPAEINDPVATQEPTDHDITIQPVAHQEAPNAQPAAIDDTSHQETTGEQAVAAGQETNQEATNQQPAIHESSHQEETGTQPNVAAMFGVANDVTVVEASADAGHSADAEHSANVEDNAEPKDSADVEGATAFEQAGEDDDVIADGRHVHPLFLGVLAAKTQHYFAQSVLLSVALAEELASATTYQELVGAQIEFVQAQMMLFGDEWKWLSRAYNGIVAPKAADAF